MPSYPEIDAAADEIKRGSTDLSYAAETVSLLAFGVVGGAGELLIDGPALARKDELKLASVQRLLGIPNKIKLSVNNQTDGPLVFNGVTATQAGTTPVGLVDQRAITYLGAQGAYVSAIEYPGHSVNYTSSNALYVSEGTMALPIQVPGGVVVVLTIYRANS